MVDVINPGLTAGIGGGQSQINPLAMAQQFAATQNAMNQNALFQQTFKARQVMGELARQATDANGNFDQDKMNALVASHPDTASIAADYMNTQLRNKQVSAETLRTSLQNKQIQADGLAGIYAAISKDPSINDASDIAKQGYISQMHELGIPTPALIAMLADPKQLGGLKGDGIRNYARVHSIAYQHGSNAMTALDNDFDHHLSFNEDGSWNAGWRNRYYDTAQNIGQPGQAPGLGGALSAGPTAGAAALNAPGAQPPSNPLSPTQPVQPPAAPASSGPRFGEPSPTKVGQLKWLGETYYPKLQEAATSAQSLLNTIGEGKQLLATAATGRAAPTRLEIARWLTSANVSEETARKVAGGDPYTTQALEKLVLYVGTQGMATANKGNAAVRSVQEWNKFMEANPNLKNDKQAITKMWDFMSYQASLVRQEQNEFNSWQKNERDLTQFPAKWNDFVDDQTGKYFKSRFGGQGGQ